MADRLCPLTGYDLGFCALAAVLRNAPGPRSMGAVHRVLILTLMAATGESNPTAACAGISFLDTCRDAFTDCVVERANGLWKAGPEIEFALEPTLEPLAVQAWATLATWDTPMPGLA